MFISTYVNTCIYVYRDIFNININISQSERPCIRKIVCLFVCFYFTAFLKMFTEICHPKMTDGVCMFTRVWGLIFAGLRGQGK